MSIIERMRVLLTHIRANRSSVVAREFTIVAFLIAIFTLTACGVSKRREASTAEMKRVAVAFGDLQIALDAGVSKQEFSQRLNDALVKIGDLAESMKVAETGLPKDADKVEQAYSHFRHAVEAYKLSKVFFGDRWDYLLELSTDLTSESEQQVIKASYPSLAAPEIELSRSATLHGLWKFAAAETQASNESIEKLSK
jgi:hypothetical protein